MRRLKCPNCGKAMDLEKEEIQYKLEKHDLWGCPDCAHITVLDNRFK